MRKLNNYMTLKAAAEHLGVPKSTLILWLDTGKIACHRHPVTDKRLFLVEDLDQLLKKAEESKT